jgi:hypothetical protein
MDSSFSFRFPAQVDSVASPKGAKDEAGRGILRLIQIRLAALSLEKIWLGCQDNSPQA